MKTVHAWAVGASLLASACQSESRPTAHSPSAPHPTAAAAVPDSLRTPAAAGQAFLRWYSRNWTRLARIPLVPASLDQDPANLYSVDPRGVQQYVAAFRASGFVSDAFIDNERQLVLYADSLMRAEPQTDGPPRGLDFDHLLSSQDPEGDLALLVRSTPAVVSADSTHAVLRFAAPPGQFLEGGNLELLLSRHRGRWLIDASRSLSSD